jgi:hypothetical protein
MADTTYLQQALMAAGMIADVELRKAALKAVIEEQVGAEFDAAADKKAFASYRRIVELERLAQQLGVITA